MIRKLTEQDRCQVLEYLNQEPSFNIFIIGDIETFGFEKSFQSIYAEFDEDNNYKSVLLFYNENSVYYSHKIYFNKEYLAIIEKEKPHYLSGKKELMDLLVPYVTNVIRKDMYFARVKTIDFSIPKDKAIKTFKTKKEAEKLYNLLLEITEFDIYRKDKEKFINDKMLSKKMGTTLFIEEDHKAVSCVATTAESTTSAMVVSVATAKEYRKAGLATKLMQQLMTIYIKEKNKELCLFYDNPEAGNIYLRLGFENIGMWTILKKQ